MSKTVLAFDFGASSGRAMLCRFDGIKIEIEEIHRFTNDPVKIGDTLYWDVLRLFYEIKQGILKAAKSGGFDSIGIDTWGVDFGLIDKNGELIANPVHYRDGRTIGMMEKAFLKLDKDTLYKKTGIQFMRINTVFQLLSLTENKPDIIKSADKFLMMPCLLSYFLTGEKKAEFTTASTSQILNASTYDWDFEIAEKLSIPKNIFPPVIDCGSVYGMLSDSVCDELSVKKVPVIAVASHDTASAVAAVPSEQDDFIYISCGTWSLFGTETDEPIINEKTFEFNLTNSGSCGKKNMLLKNIMGLWLIQESRRYWQRQGDDVSYADLEKEALSAESFKCFIDPDDSAFELPGNLPERIVEFCEKTGQYVPKSRGEIMRCIYESLALKYKYTFDAIRYVTGKDYSQIHIIGGGTKDGLLCQMTADSCEREIVAGPAEATVAGNAAVQFIALKEIKDLKDARKIISNSFELKTYKPENSKRWNSAYNKFIKLIKGSALDE